jgi:predicted dehydrogenase
MSQNRRQFLQHGAGVVAASAVTPYLFTSTTARAQSANDKHVFGCIGTGSRWRAVVQGAMKHGDVVAVCDVDKEHLEQGNKLVGGKAEMFEDYRKILDNKKIDVVTIVTTDHWHTKIAIEAMQAGKDVYCEKPLTLTIDEGKLINKVQKETKRVFQVGTQQRSEMSGKDETGHVHAMQFLKAVALIQSGSVGKVKRIHCFIGGGPVSESIPKVEVPKRLNWDMWLGQAPKTDFRATMLPGGKDHPFGKTRVHYEFRWWYEYSGGKLTDWGAHHVDIATWMIGMDAEGMGPISVEPIHATHPVKLDAKGMPTADDMYNVATTFAIKATFPNGVEMIICDSPKSAKDLKMIDGNGKEFNDNNGIYVEGDKGTLFVSRGRLYGTGVAALKEKPLDDAVLSKLYKGKKPGSGHMTNFIDCVRDRGTPASDVHTHHRAMTTCHLSNIAIRLNRTLKWDAVKEEIVGDADANAMQKREQRKGYEIKA